MPANTTDLEKRLWEAADNLRANSKLKSSEYSVPVLGLVFLSYAEYRFLRADLQLQNRTSRRAVTATDYQALGVMFLPADARYSMLLQMPEGANVGAAVNEAMRSIERENPDLKDVLPKTYNRFENSLLVGLLKSLNPASIGQDFEGDAFGKIYEYFLGKFAMTEGQKGGEFFTPTSVVELIVEILEPYHGRIYDPACGSGGMFVQSARFVDQHAQNPSDEISVYGQEKTAETVRLCRMNLAVHGLSGDVRQGNTYYEDLHSSVTKTTEGRFDFVMANPPFNVDKVDKDRLKGDPRFPFGLPSTDNANYLWIQHFYSSLSRVGRAGFVMANSASDARGSELEIRKKIIQAGAVDVMLSVGSNFFYTVTLPCTLWFFDQGKRGTPREDTVLFVDARHVFRQVDRAHREFTRAQIEMIAGLVRLYRGVHWEFDATSNPLLFEHFPDGQYRDVLGLCKAAPRAEIEAQGWSLNPGRYVGVAEKAADDFVFAERLEELNEELEVLNSEARELEDRIAQNVTALLEVAV